MGLKYNTRGHLLNEGKIGTFNVCEVKAFQT